MSDSSSLLLIAGCYERFLFGFKCSAEVEVRSAGIMSCIYCSCYHALQERRAALAVQTHRIDRTFSYPAHKVVQVQLLRTLQHACMCKLTGSELHVQGAVKCIATSGNVLASGGVDDLIHIYDLHVSHLGRLLQWIVIGMHLALPSHSSFCAALQKGRDLGYLMNPGDGAVTALAFHHAPAAAGPSYLLNGSSDGSVSVWQASSRDTRLPEAGYCLEQASLCRIMALGVGGGPDA
jgi:WD40 repeat protein